MLRTVVLSWLLVTGLLALALVVLMAGQAARERLRRRGRRRGASPRARRSSPSPSAVNGR